MWWNKITEATKSHFKFLETSQLIACKAETSNKYSTSGTAHLKFQKTKKGFLNFQNTILNDVWIFESLFG